jgi:hypothetical protein
MTILAIYSRDSDPVFLLKDLELKSYGLAAHDVISLKVDEDDCRQIIHVGKELGLPNVAVVVFDGAIEQIYNENSLDEFLISNLQIMIDALVVNKEPIYLYIMIDSDVSTYENILFVDGGDGLMNHFRAYGGWCPLFYDLDNKCITISDRFSILCKLN